MSDRRQRILDQVSDPSVRKMLIMGWYERGEITHSEARRLIKSNKLEAA